MKLAKLRKSYGLTQIELSELTGFSRSKIQRHETGEDISPEDYTWYLCIYDQIDNPPSRKYLAECERADARRKER